MSRIDAPMIRSIRASTILTLGVIPAIYALIKQRRVGGYLGTTLKPSPDR